ncbi:MAG: hypothetical protein CM15mP102_20570 [Flavobacteriales bacterium]|nr:MAG: hypothetical protein CM15mP102_20570 [Flavobacteriales bacterium]
MFGLWMFGSTLANLWGANKFIFFLFIIWFRSCGNSNASILLNVESVTSDLLNYGVSKEVIAELFRSGSINTSVFDYVSRETLANAYNDYNSVMVGASGAIYGILVAFTFMFPNSKLMLLFLQSL